MSRPATSSRANFRAWYRYATRWTDNDVYGHVNNTVYYQWFDSAVNAWLLEQGLIRLQGDDDIALVVETRCSFAVPLSYPQAIDVGLAVKSIGRSSVRYRIGIFPTDGDTAAAEGEFVHVLVGGQNRRPVEFPDRWRRALETLA